MSAKSKSAAVGFAVFGAAFGGALVSEFAPPRVDYVRENEFLYRVEKSEDLASFGDPVKCSKLQTPVHVEPGDVLGVRLKKDGCHQVWKLVSETEAK